MAEPKQQKRSASGKTSRTAASQEQLETGDHVALENYLATVATGTESNPTHVRLTAPSDRLVAHQFLWEVIKDRTDAIGFNRYRDCIEHVLCDEELQPASNVCLPYDGAGTSTEEDGSQDCVSVQPPGRRGYSVHGPDSYLILRAATECFLMQECGQLAHVIDRIGKEFEARPLDEAELNILREQYHTDQQREAEPRVLPYFDLIRRRLGELPLKKGLALGAKSQQDSDGKPGCYGILRSRLSGPCFIELIWSYWHEEAMLVQTMNAISLRFQNIRNPVLNDPLAHLAVDPLRALNNLLWGHIQDERNRLTVVRRAYEYEHHYGINLLGKAVPKMSPVDRRSKFMEAFHNLLHLCTVFFRQVDDLTVQADGFPVLNALKQVHMLLAEGAHNQYGDLPWTSRVEMLMMMWLLGRPEFREFLGGRIMVPYAETWMDRVDTMKSLQGWTDTSVTVFNTLATEGERLLLSIRFTNWSQIDSRGAAAAWANFWRDVIQSYVHSYRVATGVDLASQPRDSRQQLEWAQPPAIHLSRRLAGQKSGQVLPPASQAGVTRRVRALPTQGTR